MAEVYYILRRAKIAWFCQYARCYKPTHKAYKYYGGRGIRIEYSKNDFYLSFIDKCKNIQDEELSTVTVGRIDHSKNYTLDNIEIQTKSDNSRERIKRVGNTGLWKDRGVLAYKDGVFIGKFDSVSDAGRATNYDISGVVKICRGKMKKSKNGYTFRYLDDKLVTG